MSRLFAGFGLVIGLIVTGCESNSPPAVKSTTPDQAANPESVRGTTKSPAPTVTLDIKNWDETLELVAQHKGKVVMLDVWSTSCTPCMDEFPHLVELHKKHGEKLVCMSASCDYVGIKSKPPESYRDGVLEFLTKQNATFQNVLLNVDADTLFAKIDLASIPAVYVFGTNGKVAKRFDNDNAKAGEEFTYTKDVVPFVEKLLEGKKNEELRTENGSGLLFSFLILRSSFFIPHFLHPSWLTHRSLISAARALRASTQRADRTGDPPSPVALPERARSSARRQAVS